MEHSRDVLLRKLRQAVHDNLTNEQFGVEALARLMGMSRSLLHRKLRAMTGQSVSQFIREYRIELGMALLKQGGLTAAEVADRVGFGSATYFNKCFHEYFGFPPGEVKNRTIHGRDGDASLRTSKVREWKPSRSAVLILAIVAVASLITAIALIYFDHANRPSATAGPAIYTQLSSVDAQARAYRGTENSRAYDIYQKAAYEYHTYTNEGIHNAITLLHDCIALDSQYAQAYALMANSYNGLATIFGAELGAREALDKGKPFIDKALALDSTLDEGHALLAFYRLYHDWDFRGAESEYKKAITSGNPDAVALYIDYLNFVSRHDEAMALAEQLNKVDPYYPNSRMIQCYVFTGRLDEGLEFSESRLKMFKNYLTLDSHGFLLLNMGRYDDAVLYFQKAIALEGRRYPRMLGWMGAAYAKSGERQSAQEILSELELRHSKNEKGSIAFFIAVIHSALGDKAEALRWLEVAVETHDMEVPWLTTEPQFANLRHTTEFQALVRRVGFPSH